MGRRWILHPLLFAAYPILVLFSQNLGQVTVSVLPLPIGIALAQTLLLWGILWLLLRDWHKSALATSVWSLAYAVYQPTLDPIELVLLFAVASSLTVCIVRFLKTSVTTLNINYIVNVVSLALVSVVTAQMAIQFSEFRSAELPRATASTPQESAGAPPTVAPHVIYLILDGYGRADVLRDLYELDNSAFIRFLREKGFYVADDSHANYMNTGMSLSSSLNFDYLEEAFENIDLVSQNWDYPRQLIRRNQLFEVLKGHGYETVSFETSYDVTEIVDADRYLSLPHVANEFSRLVNKETRTDEAEIRRDLTLFALDELPELVREPDPLVVFSHIISPHYPAFWDQEGNEIVPDKKPFYAGTTDPDTYSTEEYRQLYRGQVTHLNSVLQEAIDKIFANTSRPLIFVIQGDHGPQSEVYVYDLWRTYHKERMSILNAYYFFDRDYDQLDGDISPVNSFRVILNTFFGTSLSLLENKHFYSTWSAPYRFYNISALLDGPSQEQGYDQVLFGRALALAETAASQGDWQGGCPDRC